MEVDSDQLRATIKADSLTIYVYEEEELNINHSTAGFGIWSNKVGGLKSWPKKPKPTLIILEALSFFILLEQQQTISTEIVTCRKVDFMETGGTS